MAKYTQPIIDAAYRKILGRGVDAEGLRHYTAGEFWGNTSQDLENDLMQSAEYKARQPAVTPQPAPSPMSTPAPTTSSLFSDVLTKVSNSISNPTSTPTKASQLFADYETKAKAVPKRADLMTKYNNQFGVQAVQDQLNPITQMIRESQNTLGKVGDDIRTETQGNVTESQRLALTSERERPIRQRISDLFTQAAPLQDELKQKQEMVSQFTDAELSDATDELTRLAEEIRINPEIDPNNQLKDELSMIASLIDAENANRPSYKYFTDNAGNVTQIDEGTGTAKQFGGVSAADKPASSSSRSSGGFDLNFGPETTTSQPAPTTAPTFLKKGSGIVGGAQWNGALQTAANYLRNLRDAGILRDPWESQPIYQQIVSQFVGGLRNTKGSVQSKLNNLILGK